MVIQQHHTTPATLCFVGPNNMLIVKHNNGAVIVNKQPVKYIKKLAASSYRSNKVEGNNTKFVAKEFLLYPGEHSTALMEYYCHKYWIVLSGLAWITIDQTTNMVSARQGLLIPPMQEHSIHNSTTEPLKFVEVCAMESLTGQEEIQFIDNPVFV